MSTRKEQVHNENMAEIHRLTGDLCDKIIKNTQKVLVNQDINFTFDLSKSIHKEEYRDQKWVVVDSKYGVPVEFGMPPGIHVNFDELRKWVEGKLGIAHDESQKVTTAIWHKILSKGIPPTRFFKKGIKLTIGQVGILTLRNTRIKEGKFWKKSNKYVRKANRITNKVIKARKKIHNI